MIFKSLLTNITLTLRYLKTLVLKHLHIGNKKRKINISEIIQNHKKELQITKITFWLNLSRDIHFIKPRVPSQQTYWFHYRRLEF